MCHDSESSPRYTRSPQYTRSVSPVSIYSGPEDLNRVEKRRAEKPNSSNYGVKLIDLLEAYVPSPTRTPEETGSDVVPATFLTD